MDRLLSLCLAFSIALHLVLLKGIPFALPKYNLNAPIEVDLKSLPSASPSKKLQAEKRKETKQKAQKRIVKARPKPKIRPKPKSKSKPKPKPKSKPKPEQSSKFNPKPKPQPLKEIEPATPSKQEKLTPSAKQNLETPKTQPEASSKALAQVNKVKTTQMNTSGNQLSNHSPAESLLRAYLSRVHLRIEQHKEYPLWARWHEIEGKVVVVFSLKKDGQLEGLKIEKSSGYSLLDKAAIKAIKKAAPFPAFPPGLNKEIITLRIPIYFYLK